MALSLRHTIALQLHNKPFFLTNDLDPWVRLCIPGKSDFIFLTSVIFPTARNIVRSTRVRVLSWSRRERALCGESVTSNEDPGTECDPPQIFSPVFSTMWINFRPQFQNPPPPPRSPHPSLNCQLWLRIPSLALDFLPLIKCSITVMDWPQFRSPCSLDLPVDCVFWISFARPSLMSSLIRTVNIWGGLAFVDLRGSYVSLKHGARGGKISDFYYWKL